MKDILEKSINSKLVNQSIKIYFKALLEAKNLSSEKEILSLPILNIDDLENIKLQSSIFEKNNNIYYCQGYINQEYNSISVPKMVAFDPLKKVDLKESIFSSFNATFKEEKQALKEKYFQLLDKIKTFIIKEKLTEEEVTVVLDFLDLYHYLEIEEIQNYQATYNPFFLRCLSFIHEYKSSL